MRSRPSTCNRAGSECPARLYAPTEQRKPVRQPGPAVIATAPGRFRAAQQRTQTVRAPRIECQNDYLPIQRQHPVDLSQQGMGILAEFKGVTQHNEIDRMAA